MSEMSLDVQQLINIGLTAIIMLAVVAQAWSAHAQTRFMRDQGRLLEESERRARERDEPKLHFSYLSHEISLFDESNCLTTPRIFEGFMVQNTGFTEVEIVSFAFELGMMRISTETTEVPASAIGFRPVREDSKTVLSTMKLPHRLRRGESFKVFFDKEKLVQRSLREGGGTSVRMRPYCHDSLGNKFVANHWFTYRDIRSLAAYGSPSPSRISQEDWERLEPNEQQGYSVWFYRGNQ